MLLKGLPVRTGPITEMRASTLRAVKREVGLGWAQVMAYMDATDDETPLGDCLGDDHFLAWVFAWWRNAVPTVTFEDVCNLTVGDIEFTGPQLPAVEHAAVEVEADPTQASAPEVTAAADALPVPEPEPAAS